LLIRSSNCFREASISTGAFLFSLAYDRVAEMHSMHAEYHRKLAKEAQLGIVRDYHVDLAQRFAASSFPHLGNLSEDPTFS
jgi:hypothetical protein